MSLVLKTAGGVRRQELAQRLGDKAFAPGKVDVTSEVKKKMGIH